MGNGSASARQYRARYRWAAQTREPRWSQSRPASATRPSSRQRAFHEGAVPRYVSTPAAGGRRKRPVRTATRARGGSVQQDRPILHRAAAHHKKHRPSSRSAGHPACTGRMRPSRAADQGHGRKGIAPIRALCHSGGPCADALDATPGTTSARPARRLKPVSRTQHRDRPDVGSPTAEEHTLGIDDDTMAGGEERLLDDGAREIGDRRLVIDDSRPLNPTPPNRAAGPRSAPASPRSQRRLKGPGASQAGISPLALISRSRAETGAAR